MPKLIDCGKFFTILILGTFLGYGGALISTNMNIQESVSSFFGAVLGAVFTVAGSVWLTSWQTLREKRQAELYVSDAVFAIWKESYYLSIFAGRKSWEDNSAYATLLLKQLVRLKQSVNFFSENMPTASLYDYGLKRRITDLERAIDDKVRTLEKEEKWLSKSPTTSVIENSQGDLIYAASDIIGKCDQILQLLKSDLIIPTEKDQRSHEKMLDSGNPEAS